MAGRRHAQEAAARQRSQSVFINCPFADSHISLFLAYVVGARVVGLTPRAAIEAYDSRAARLERIQHTLAACAYSFHDISFVHLDDAAALPRFNMPLELGMAVNEGFHSDHVWYIFDREPYQALATTSDLNGREVLTHGGTPEQILRLIMNNVVGGSALSLQAMLDVYRQVHTSVVGPGDQIAGVDFFTPRTFQLIVGATASAL